MKKTIYVSTALVLFWAWQPATALAQADDSLLSDSHIVAQDSIEAEVIRVRPIERTITVKGEKRGQTRQFSVPEGARVSVNGKQARLRDLRRGDMILIKFAQQPDQVVVEQIRMPDAPVTLAERRAQPVPAEATPAVLPSTASFMPAVFLAGLIALAGAALMRRLRA